MEQDSTIGFDSQCGGQLMMYDWPLAEIFTCGYEEKKTELLDGYKEQIATAN